MYHIHKNNNITHIRGSDTGSSEFIVRKRINKFWQHIPNLKQYTILDYGCGEGRYSYYLAIISKKVIGVDIDLSKIRKAEETYTKKNLEFMDIKNDKLIFHDQSFDLIFLNEVLEHIVDMEMTLEEITRVLKKNGFLVIYAPNRLYPFEQHGFEIKGKKYGTKVPFITWLPDTFAKRYVKFFARQYSYKDLKEIADQYKYAIIHHDNLAPPCDGIQRKNYCIGSTLKIIFDTFEKIPILKMFMMSHLLILKKI